MSKLKKKLNQLNRDKIKKKWENIDSEGGLSTREKLEKLVDLNLKREGKQKVKIEVKEKFQEDQTLIIRDLTDYTDFD